MISCRSDNLSREAYPKFGHQFPQFEILEGVAGGGQGHFAFLNNLGACFVLFILFLVLNGMTFVDQMLKLSDKFRIVYFFLGGGTKFLQGPFFAPPYKSHAWR